jgi:hypothetical protein
VDLGDQRSVVSLGVGPVEAVAATRLALFGQADVRAASVVLVSERVRSGECRYRAEALEDSDDVVFPWPSGGHPAVVASDAHRERSSARRQSSGSDLTRQPIRACPSSDWHISDCVSGWVSRNWPRAVFRSTSSITAAPPP